VVAPGYGEIRTGRESKEQNNETRFKDGMVTLKGPVRSDVAAKGKVTSQLEVKPKQ
jgi:hypothetical protein